MKNYLTLAPKYLSAHKRKTRLTIFSVMMAVTLVVGIFSMLDSVIRFGKEQAVKEEGNYHILIRKPTEGDILFVRNRLDVAKSGSLKDFGYGSINGEKCDLGTIDENFAENMNFAVTKGHFPKSSSEIMLEKWYMEKTKPVLKIGDEVNLVLSNGTTGTFTISGQYRDWGATKAASIPIVFMSPGSTAQITPKTHDYFILFKSGVNISKSENEIKKALNLTKDRIAANDRLLAFMLQSRNNRVIEIYGLGAALFFLVLVTGVVMIYNTFNISIMERVRHFGLLRCIGASPGQIKRLVRREGFSLALRAVPIGLLTGTLMSCVCTVVLKYYNSKEYGDIQLFRLSLMGLGAGAVIGFLTVYIASLMPAKKAARVSPVNALTGSSEMKISKRNKRGFLTKLFPAEVAMGIGNGVKKKKTLLLMTCSIAFSITIFLGFNVLVNPDYLGMKAIRSYTPDLSLTSAQGMGKDTLTKLSSIDGIKRVFGRKSGYVNAASDKELTGAADNAWLLSYDKTQLKWAKGYLKSGVTEEEKLNAGNGIIAVVKNWQNNALKNTVKLHLGDRISIKTATGTKEFTVMGLVDSSPYKSEKQTMITFITTEKLFDETMGDSGFTTLDIQLKGGNREKTVNEIKSLVGKTVTFHDIRQLNEDARSAFLTSSVFIYGFVGIIALISVLNIINTMSSSVVAKTRYLGVMRAVGMTDAQLTRLVLTEAVIYCISGCIAGCTFGMVIRKAISDFLLADWKFPAIQVAGIFAFCILAAALSVLRPLKRVKERGISEVIASV